MCIHTYIYIYIHTYIHTYVRTYIHTYVHACINYITLLYTTLHYVTLHYIDIYIHTCEWELGYGITYVPTYIALIIPLPRGHECRPFGSSHYSCRSPRKEHSCRSCDPVVVSKDNSTHYLQEAYIG